MRLFVTDGTEQKVFTRSKATGYKKFDCSEVTAGTCVDFVTDGDVLKAVPVEGKPDKDTPITILCKEFGLADKSKKMKHKISVIYLDEGYMLVTLHEGAILISVDGKQLMPSVGVVPDTSFDINNVFWCDANELLSYGKYMEEKEGFMQDFEFMYVLQGYRPNGYLEFIYRHEDEEDIDMSLGNFAAHLQQEANKKSAREARKMMTMFSKAQASASSVEFDDDDEDEEDYEDDDDDYDFI